MSDELKKYLKYPVIIPVFEVKREVKDYLQIFKLLYAVGIALTASSSILLLFYSPDKDISIYLLISSLLLSIPLILYHTSKIFYGLDWIRLRIECELPYFIASMKFLMDSGKTLLDSVKIIVGENIFPYISNTLSGVESATNNLELEDIADRSRSPLLRGVIRESSVDKSRINRLMDESYKRYADYETNYLHVLNWTYKTLFYIIILTSITPIIEILYHTFTYTELPDDYVLQWGYATMIYLILLLTGLGVILISTILMYKPLIYPKIVFKHRDLMNWSRNKRDIVMFTSLFIILSIPALTYPITIVIPILTAIYLLHRRYTTVSDVEKIPDLLNDFTYLSRESDLGYALQGLMGKSYGRYLDEQVGEAWKTYNEDNVVNVDDPNLKPYFRIVSKSGEMFKDAVEEYTVDVNSLNSVSKYVEDRFKASSPKPYLGFTLLYLIFIPLLYASGYILSFISIPLLMLFELIKNFSSFPYQNINTSGFGSTNFWGNFSIPTISIPPLSTNIFNIFTMPILVVIFLYSLIETYGRRDYKPTSLILYVAGAMIFYIAVLLSGSFLIQLLSF